MTNKNAVNTYIVPDTVDNIIPIISGINEKYMIQELDYFSSDTHIIVFTGSDCFNDTLKQLFGLKYCCFDDHKLNLLHKQITIIGNYCVNDDCVNNDCMNDDCVNDDIVNFSFDVVRKKGIKSVLDHILSKHVNKHIVCLFSLDVFDETICPSVNRNKKAIVPNNDTNDDDIVNLLDDERSIITDRKTNNNFNANDINEIANCLKDKIQSLIISNFNFTIDNNVGYFSRITSEVIQILYKTIMNIKECRLNVFNQHSRFLIFRPFEQSDVSDVGWYILRFLNSVQKNLLLSKIPDDTIMILNIEDLGDIQNDDNDDDIELDEVMIATTTIDEQNKKNYYTATDTMDCCLYPQDKLCMTFELVT